jgi:hypothetical protein
MVLSLNVITTESYPEAALKMERYYLLASSFVFNLALLILYGFSGLLLSKSMAV